MCRYNTFIRTLAVSLVAFAASTEVLATDSVQLVLSEGETVPGDTVKLFHDEKCRVAFQSDGNLSINKRFGNPPYNPIGPFPTMWDTGVIGSGEYEYAMKTGGNFKIYQKVEGAKEVIYFTHSNTGSDGPFFLGIDKTCILGIYEGTPQSMGKQIWTNIRTEALKPGDRLYRGEIYRDVKRNAFMILQNADANLVVYDGQDFSDSTRTPLWASHTRGDALPDYHLDIHADGSLKLYEQGPPKRLYYTKDLQADGEECFNVVLDTCTYEPIAVPRPCPHDIEVVMRDGDVIPSKTAVSFHDGRCTVRLQDDGNLNVYTGPFFMWHTGWAIPNAIGDYVLALRSSGRLIIKQGTPGGNGAITFDTDSDGPRGNYYLGIDSSCVLSIFRGLPEDAGEAIWTNIRTRLSSGERLERSEVFYDQDSNQSMLLQHPDGNLVVYEGFPGEIDYGLPPRWAATAFGASTPDYFLKVTKQGGKIRLIDQGTGASNHKEYYSKVLDADGCFDLALDAATGEPIAKEYY